MAQEHFTRAPSQTRDSDLHGTHSIPELIRGVADDITTLFSKELALAKAEMREAAASAKAGISGMAVGGSIAFAGLIMLLLSAVYGLNNVVEPWLSALIVGLAAVLVGFLLLKSGQKKVEPAAFVPEKTIDSVRKDKNTAKRVVQ